MAQAKIIGTAQVQHITELGRIIDVPIYSAGNGNLFLETKDLDFGKPGMEKYLDNVVLDLEARVTEPQFRVLVGHRMNLKDPVVWKDCGFIDFSNPIVKVRLTARFFSFKFVDEIPVNQWKLSRIECYGAFLGGGRL